MPWVEPTDRTALDALFADFGRDTRAVLRCLPERLSRWAIHVLDPPLESFVRSRVALLGDAVSPRPPSLPLRARGMLNGTSALAAPV